MSQQPKVYFTRKRRRDMEEEEQRKQKKNEAAIESKTATEPSTFQTKLTDVNDDCLEKIFMHFDLDDFLNIAHANKELKTGADLAFSRKFGKTQFVINNRTLKTSFRLLRCYGDFVSDLQISDLLFQRRLVKVLGYTNQYCVKSLKEISFFKLPEDVLEMSMEKPLPKLETIRFSCCRLGNEIPKFHTWFPAMRSLTFNQCHLTDRTAIETHFPQLEEIYIDTRGSSNNDPTADNVKMLLQLNLQLRCITLHDLEHLQGVSQHLPLLEKLTIWGSVFGDDSDEIRFKSVKKLNWYFFIFPRVNLIFDQLEEFSMLSHLFQITDDAVQFFEKHQSIRKLKLVAYNDRNKENMMKIVAHLPLLTYFTYKGHEFSAEETVRFLVKFKSLDHFRFRITDPAEFQRLKTMLGDKWLATESCEWVNLKRKV